jgi:hypothetical protein
MVSCNPSRTEEISLEDAFRWIDDIQEYHDGQIRVLALTGGEPFFDIARLRAITDYARGKGLYVSVISNGYWASSKEEALSILSSLPGIGFIALSTDDYHQIAIPLDNVRNALDAANALGLHCEVHICTENENSPSFISTKEKLLEWVDNERIKTSVVFPFGEASNLILDQDLSIDGPPRISCPIASIPLIFPDGIVKGCVGPALTLKNQNPLILGDLRKEGLSQILDRAEMNPILHAIRIWGPAKIVDVLKEKGYGDILPELYSQQSICNTCYALLSNPKIIKIMENVLLEDDVMELISNGRAYHLGENIMLEKFLEKSNR